MKEGLKDKKQGVYGILLMRNRRHLKTYVGSAWSLLGLRRRVKQHRNPKYRAKVLKRGNGKALYKYMNMPDVTVKYVCLALYDQGTSKHTVLVTEGLLACLLAGYNSAAYRRTRSKIADLEGLSWDSGCNRQDPLCEGPPKWRTRAAHQAKWERMLEKAQNGGPYTLSTSTGKALKFGIGIFDFTVPAKIVSTMGLLKGNRVRVNFVEFDEPTPEKTWVTYGHANDPGNRLGIQISITLDGEDKSAWLKRRYGNDNGAKMANSLCDWLHGHIKNPQTHQWPDRRFAFIGPSATEEEAVVIVTDQKRARGVEDAAGPSTKKPKIEQSNATKRAPRPIRKSDLPPMPIVCGRCGESETVDKTPQMDDAGGYIPKKRVCDKCSTWSKDKTKRNSLRFKPKDDQVKIAVIPKWKKKTNEVE